MRRINPLKAALAVGYVIGLYHLAWAALVSSGYARAVMDIILRLHFIQMEYEMAPFDAATGVTLVAITFAIGAAFGLFFALFWNWMADSAAPRDMNKIPEAI